MAISIEAYIRIGVGGIYVWSLLYKGPVFRLSKWDLFNLLIRSFIFQNIKYTIMTVYHQKMWITVKPSVFELLPEGCSPI